MIYSIKGFSGPTPDSSKFAKWATTSDLDEFRAGRPEIGPPRYLWFHDRIRGLVFTDPLPTRYDRD